MPKTVDLLARLSGILDILQAAINSVLFVTEYQLESTELTALEALAFIEAVY